MAIASDLTTEEVRDLARRIAAISGESEVDAIVISLTERLARLEERRRKRAELDELRRQWRANPRADAHFRAEDLYDEHGLPK